ncbi:MAG: histidine--tRNA ligase [Pseudomonadota bacterium]
MANKSLQAIRGMNDILPEQTPVWQYVENILRHVATSYGYREIRFPILEYTDLFKRAVGKVTDIVEKEMYTFDDRNGDSLTLRPEGTAGCVRAGIEHSLLYHQVQRLWYFGPSFRHERPQKGRFRQFHQWGVEAFGMTGPEIDIELILMMTRIFKLLNIDDFVTLQINSLGTPAIREVYREELVKYFSTSMDQLDEDSHRRLETNPLRILDSKNPEMKKLITGAPKLLDMLDESAQQHFDRYGELLDEAGIQYEINPCLVRGLDYYSHVVFEWVTDSLGAQGTVCAGGRFDGLVEQLGGDATPAVGFALGMERLIALIETAKQLPVLKTTPDIYMVSDEYARAHILLLAEKIREAMPALVVQVDCVGGQWKKQFKRADASGAHLALVMGEQELKNHTVAVKYLREKREQETVELADIVAYIADFTRRNGS